MKIILPVIAGIVIGIMLAFAWALWYFRDVMK